MILYMANEIEIIIEHALILPKGRYLLLDMAACENRHQQRVRACGANRARVRYITKKRKCSNACS
jgi:hypothetical protein